MKHFLESSDGAFRYEVEMGCNHPDMQGNSTESVGCKGNCETCQHSVATMTIPSFLELAKRADCYN